MRHAVRRAIALPMLVDSHCHLEMPDFDPDRAGTIRRAWDAGLGFVLTIGDASNPPAFKRSLDLASADSRLATTIGLHPHQADQWCDATREFLLQHARSPRVVAIGEIGLDFHYDYSPRDSQRRAFSEQVLLARDLDLPVIVHCRKAEPEVFDTLASTARPGRLNGILHCFTGDLPYARRMADLGFLISFSGIVTFPRAEQIREAAARLPEESILIETDAPYLAPVPFRGKRNEPAFVARTAAVLAELRGCEPDRVADVTTMNFFRLFPGLAGNGQGAHA